MKNVVNQLWRPADTRELVTGFTLRNTRMLILELASRRKGTTSEKARGDNYRQAGLLEDLKGEFPQGITDLDSRPNASQEGRISCRTSWYSVINILHAWD